MMNLNRFPMNDLKCILRHVFSIQKRYKHKKEHWSVIAKKKRATDRALEHFDDFYKNVYGTRWPSIRLALLSPHKYCAVINNFGDLEKATSYLQNRGAMDLKTLFGLEKERLKDQDVDSRKQRDMDKIFKLDREMELMMIAKQEQEYGSVYPASEGGARTLAHDSGQDKAADVNKSSDHSREESPVEAKEGDGEKRFNLSLQASLDQAEIDQSRVIHPVGGLSSAALYEFVPATKLKGKEDWVLESEHYGYYKKNTDFPVHIKQEENLNFPNHLNVYMYERGNVSTFPSPKRGSTGVFNYYLLDGGSVLPVLALDIQPGDQVLDMCAAPGGKSLLMMQTLHTGRLVCNDIQESRVNRINSVMRQYLYDMDKWSDQLIITQRDGRLISEQDAYNKILVDVPCTTDRHAVHENDNNIFKQSRTKERLKLPEMQAALLSSALKLVQCGGTVVYSTCSLSPVQNDGVVHMALRTIWEETNIKLEIRDLSTALAPMHSLFRLSQDLGLKYGHLVVPFLPCNFGPLYFCKIVRTS